MQREEKAVQLRRRLLLGIPAVREREKRDTKERSCRMYSKALLACFRFNRGFVGGGSPLIPYVWSHVGGKSWIAQGQNHGRNPSCGISLFV